MTDTVALDMDGLDDDIDFASGFWDIVPEHVFDTKITIPTRSKPLEHVAFHLGPTNSGKTYRAIQDLRKRYEETPTGRYVYAAPLRMLAHEIYVDMVEEYGHEAVGFVTGEESINPEAPIIACTIECAPSEGDLLVVDEAHWLVDEDRGHRWTEVLLSANYQRMHIISAIEALGALTALVSDAKDAESSQFSRRTPLEYGGEVELQEVPDRSAVIVFSRRNIYNVAQALADMGRKPCVLYGALPVEIRKAQIRAFERGDFDVMVATNVVGHGINLTLDSVVFFETERFNGGGMIEIPSWESGQIAGRAGRFGKSEKGTVYSLEDGLSDLRTVRNGVAVAAGTKTSDLRVAKPYLRPSFEDLGVPDSRPDLLLDALDAWFHAVLTDGRFSPSPMNSTRRNIMEISAALNRKMENEDDYFGQREWILGARELWALVSGPFSERDRLLSQSVKWLESDAPDASERMLGYFERVIIQQGAKKPLWEGAGASLETLETAYRGIAGLKMLMTAYGQESGRLGTLTVGMVMDAERRISKRIGKMLETEIVTVEG